MLIAAIAVMALAGFAFGRLRPAVDPAMLILAMFGAVMVQSATEWAFIDERMDVVFGDPRRDASAAVVVLIAAVEGAGLWLPMLLVPWTRFVARLWSGVYALAACVLAAVYHYFPFDPIVVSQALIPTDPPPYIVAAFACLPFAAVTCVIGYLQARLVADDDPGMTLPH